MTILTHLSLRRNMFLPLCRTQWPFPPMLSSEILSGSGNPRWNHFPRHDCGKEHREEEPEMRERMEDGENEPIGDLRL